MIFPFDNLVHSFDTGLNIAGQKLKKWTFILQTTAKQNMVEILTTTGGDVLDVKLWPW